MSEPVECLKCDDFRGDMDQFMDHLEREHDIFSLAVERAGHSPGDTDE